MPYYDHDKDYPFAAFITNLGKYNEGELVGEWVKFPTTAEELKEVFKRIGIGQKDDFGQPYEEWFITDYDCYVDGLYSKLGEYENLDELNYLASKLDEMDQSDYARFQAAMEIGDYTSTLQEIINLTENLDCYDIYPDIHDYDDLGHYYLEELEVSKVPAHLQNYIDYEAYGRDVAMEENGTFTDQGYVWDTREAFHEYYDGERGSIPEEYRVMTFQDDLPEEEKSEWAMDIAFDMDKFFRQRDPQYAAEHPEEQSFNFCPTRWRSSLSSRMTSGLKYRSIGRPQIFTSCIMTGRLGIVPSFSMLARYRLSIFTISAKSFRARFFAFRAAFTSAPKVSKPGQSLMFAILHHPHTFYIS